MSSYTWKTSKPPEIKGPPVKHLSDFSEAEIAEMEKIYKAKIQRPKKQQDK